MLFLKNFQCILKDKKLILSQTLINRAGRMTIAPVGKSIIYIAYRITKLIGLCDTPWVGIPISSGAPGPRDTLEDKREAALGIWSRYGWAGGDVGGWWWGGPWN